MPRERTRKTDEGVSAENLFKAAKEVKQGTSVRRVARSYSICHVTLDRYIKKAAKLREERNGEKPRVRYWTPKKVFSNEQKEIVVEYLKEAADMFCILSSKEVKCVI
ncbi:Odorant-binding protein 10 [Caligus rogercresseyi]|uniref:Odorant-binding protein 10 n=1 Tax=Caligus rogercresseyi TaxID=217165 RepID=A0A7T8HI94_CALRO|nr:Odorant-binding protein 10 [Caligus rogercresseyi]